MPVHGTANIIQIYMVLARIKRASTHHKIVGAKMNLMARRLMLGLRMRTICKMMMKLIKRLRDFKFINLGASLWPPLTERSLKVKGNCLPKRRKSSGET